MIFGTIIAGATLGDIIGGLIITAAGLTGATAATTMAVCTTVGLAGGVAVAVSEIAMA